MKLKSFAVLPAALALSLAFAPVALAGTDKGGGDAGGDHSGGDNGGDNGGGHNKNGGGDGGGGHNKNGGGDNGGGNNGGGHNKNGGGNNGGGHSNNGGGKSHQGGGNAGRDREVLCRLDNRVIYTRSLKECRDLEFQFGFRHRPYVSKRERIQADVSISGGYVYGGGYVQGGGYAYGGGYGYYQPQRVIRYVAQPSRAAQMQAESAPAKPPVAPLRLPMTMATAVTLMAVAPWSDTAMA